MLYLDIQKGKEVTKSLIFNRLLEGRLLELREQRRIIKGVVNCHQVTPSFLIAVSME